MKKWIAAFFVLVFVLVLSVASADMVSITELRQQAEKLWDAGRRLMKRMGGRLRSMCRSSCRKWRSYADRERWKRTMR